MKKLITTSLALLIGITFASCSNGSMHNAITKLTNEMSGTTSTVNDEQSKIMYKRSPLFRYMLNKYGKDGLVKAFKENHGIDVTQKEIDGFIKAQRKHKLRNEYYSGEMMINELWSTAKSDYSIRVNQINIGKYHLYNKWLTNAVKDPNNIGDLFTKSKIQNYGNSPNNNDHRHFIDMVTFMLDVQSELDKYVGDKKLEFAGLDELYLNEGLLKATDDTTPELMAIHYNHLVKGRVIDAKSILEKISATELNKYNKCEQLVNDNYTQVSLEALDNLDKWSDESLSKIPYSMYRYQSHQIAHALLRSDKFKGVDVDYLTYHVMTKQDSMMDLVKVARDHIYELEEKYAVGERGINSPLNAFKTVRFGDFLSDRVVDVMKDLGLKQHPNDKRVFTKNNMNVRFYADDNYGIYKSVLYIEGKYYNVKNANAKLQKELGVKPTMTNKDYAYGVDIYRAMPIIGNMIHGTSATLKLNIDTYVFDHKDITVEARGESVNDVKDYKAKSDYRTEALAYYAKYKLAKDKTKFLSGFHKVGRTHYMDQNTYKRINVDLVSSTIGGPFSGIISKESKIVMDKINKRGNKQQQAQEADIKLKKSEALDF